MIDPMVCEARQFGTLFQPQNDPNSSPPPFDPSMIKLRLVNLHPPPSNGSKKITHEHNTSNPLYGNASTTPNTTSVFHSDDGVKNVSETAVSIRKDFDDVHKLLYQVDPERKTQLAPEWKRHREARAYYFIILIARE